MYANTIQESKTRQAELIREADNYRLIKSLPQQRTRGKKLARMIRGLAAQLALI